jgi:hypothetical protein
LKNVLELLSNIAFIIFLQAAVLIPLTVSVFFIRQWIIRGVQRIRYQQKQKKFERYDMDLANIPEDLHDIIPYAKKFGMVDSQERLKHQDEIPPEQKRNFALAVRGKEDEILDWLRGIYPNYSKEALAFAFMLKSLKDMHLLVDYTESSGPEIEAYANVKPAPITKRVVYYQPRPKNRIEKFIYDLFSGVIIVVIFPVFYYFIGKLWYVFSPEDESVVAFGIICTLASLFSWITFGAASHMIKRVWKLFMYY